MGWLTGVVGDELSEVLQGSELYLSGVFEDGEPSGGGINLAKAMAGR